MLPSSSVGAADGLSARFSPATSAITASAASHSLRWIPGIEAGPCARSVLNIAVEHTACQMVDAVDLLVQSDLLC